MKAMKNNLDDKMQQTIRRARLATVGIQEAYDVINMAANIEQVVFSLTTRAVYQTLKFK